MAMKKQETCPKCEGTDILKDISGRWNARHNRWDFTSAFDVNFCIECGSEFVFDFGVDTDANFCIDEWECESEFAFDFGIDTSERIK